MKQSYSLPTIYLETVDWLSWSDLSAKVGHLFKGSRDSGAFVASVALLSPLRKTTAPSKWVTYG